MRTTRLALTLILALLGLVWIGQGVGLIGGSMMTGSGFWAAAGTLLLVVAVVIAALEYRATRPS